MASLNKVFLIGNLTRDPDLKYTADGTAICNFGIAVNESFKGKDGEKKEKVGFYDVVVWGKSAENANSYLAKGRAVMIEGKLDYSTWETDDGAKRSKVSIVAQNIQYLSSPISQEGDSKPGEDDVPF